MSTRIYRHLTNKAKIVATINDLQYGIAKSNYKHYIFIRKMPNQSWVKRHGPFESEELAAQFIFQIVSEHNAIAEFKSS